jgi:putative phosphoribosyl transferase
MITAHHHPVPVTLPPHGGEGLLGLPEGKAKGIVLFAHGSGSGRLSPRNTMVADVLRAAGLATLLFDLLTEAEAADRSNVFDIPLLADRLDGAADWAGAWPASRSLSLGFFGASTGAAAALVSAARRTDVRAVVSRGGRPDLAAEALAKVAAPTLLIVGGADRQVLDLNRQAQRRLRCLSRLEVVPGATHLFEEPGAMEAVIALAQTWFRRYLGAGEGPQ